MAKKTDKNTSPEPTGEVVNKVDTNQYDLEREANKVSEEQAEAERLSKEKVEAKKLAKEQAEAERLAKEKVEAERLAKEQAEAERLAKEKVEAERLAKEKVEAERLAKEQAEAERLANEKAEAERLDNILLTGYPYKGKKYALKDSMPNRVNIDGEIYSKDEILSNTDIIESMIDSKNIFIKEM